MFEGTRDDIGRAAGDRGGAQGDGTRLLGERAEPVPGQQFEGDLEAHEGAA